MIPCPACNLAIAPDARACPRCGKNMVKPKFSAAGIFIILCMLGLLVFAAYHIIGIPSLGARIKFI